MTGGVIVINNCPRPARGLARGDLKESHFMRHDMSCIMSPGLLYQVFLPNNVCNFSAEPSELDFRYIKIGRDRVAFTSTVF